MDSPDWIKNKKTTINRLNKKDSKCFQYVVPVALNYEEIKKIPTIITRIKPFTNKCNFINTIKEINFSSEKDNRKKIEKKKKQCKKCS